MGMPKRPVMTHANWFRLSTEYVLHMGVCYSVMLQVLDACARYREKHELSQSPQSMHPWSLRLWFKSSIYIVHPYSYSPSIPFKHTVIYAVRRNRMQGIEMGIINDVWSTTYWQYEYIRHRRFHVRDKLTMLLGIVRYPHLLLRFSWASHPLPWRD